MAVFVLFAAAALLVPVASADPPPGCRVSGSGSLDTDDRFGGHARTEPPPLVVDANGRWTHRTPLGDMFQGEVDQLRCRADGGAGPGNPPSEANLADAEGVGRWNGADGYFFRVHAEDRGEPGAGRDFYSITIFDPDGVFVYFAGSLLDHGNIQIVAVR